MGRIVRINGEEFDLAVLRKHWVEDNPTSAGETTVNIILDLMKIEEQHPVVREAIEWMLVVGHFSVLNMGEF